MTFINVLDHTTVAPNLMSSSRLPHSVFIVSQVGLQQIYKCSWLYAVRIKFAFTLSFSNRLICKSMKLTSGFGLTKGLCQIARLTLLTPSIPTLKILSSTASSVPELWGLWPCCYGHIPKATFGLLVSTLPPALLTGMTRRDPDCTLTQSHYDFSTCNNFPGRPFFSPEPNLQGFVLSLPKVFEYPILVIKTIEPKILPSLQANS